VLPSQDKLIQLVLYKQLIEATFNQHIPWVTGGTSVVIPLLLNKQIPVDVNHFRVGEALFIGTNMLTNAPMEHMDQDIFKLFAEIIEITEKPKVPIGYLAENPSGEMLEVDEEDYGKTSYRAILDIGLLDISTDFLIPEDPNISFVGASSDMVVIDLGRTSRHYKVGDTLSFKLKYMGALSLLNSDYVEQRLI
jgi:predicted amino acid racemase